MRCCHWLSVKSCPSFGFSECPNCPRRKEKTRAFFLGQFPPRAARAFCLRCANQLAMSPSRKQLSAIDLRDVFTRSGQGVCLRCTRCRVALGEVFTRAAQGVDSLWARCQLAQRDCTHPKTQVHDINFVKNISNVTSYTALFLLL